MWSVNDEQMTAEQRQRAHDAKQMFAQTQPLDENLYDLVSLVKIYASDYRRAGYVHDDDRAE